MLSRRYIVDAGEVVKGMESSEQWAGTKALAMLIARDNPRFQLGRFFRDCGFKDWPQRLRQEPGGSEWLNEVMSWAAIED